MFGVEFGARRALAAAGAVIVTTCGIADLDVTGKRCPCPDGYQCETATQTCHRNLVEAGIDASLPDSAVDSPPDAPSDGAACPAVDFAEPKTIASGRNHLCVIRAGELWCWGANASGQLGIGPTPLTTPTPTRVGTESDYVHVSALDAHTCAIKSSTELTCWGANDSGQVGVGNVDPQPLPVVVDHNRSWQLVGAGQGISCAITLGGELFCWGTDQGGAAGTGQATGLQTSPYPVKSTVLFGHIGTSTYNGCAVARDGALYCWGQNDCYKSGHADNRLTPTRVGSGCWRASAGGHRHTCAIDADGKLYCWGSNSSGALGIGVLGQGTTHTATACDDAYLEPQPVMPDKTWKTVAASYLSTCAITEAGELYCWGFNDNLNVSTTPGLALDPTRVGNDTDWKEVSPGMFHTCARKQDDTLYCMGGGGDDPGVLGFKDAPLTEISW